MNAEFLERYIVITAKNGAYTTPKARKNLAPISFVGAFVVTADELEAYPVESAKKASAAATTIVVKAGPFTLTYTITTGEFTVAKT